MAPLSFTGRVALVTGAGGGLGREYALLLASRGASVVVNDLGVDRQGQGSGTKMADKVVEEIRAKGGKAAANYDSVEYGDKLVQTALENFGRIDIVINNAGFLRDRSFARISDKDWDSIHNVHLRGAFMVTRAAWPHMKKQGFGRIVMTTSASGLYGNFGQANYSAAKMGLVGLSNTLAIEGAKYNIKSNVIAPIAASRLTEDILPEDLLKLLKPEYIAPVVLYLCHEECEDTHAVFEAGAGWAGQVKVQRGKGFLCAPVGDPLTPEAVRDNWPAVCDMSEHYYPSATAESTGLIMQVLQEPRPTKKNITTSSTAASDDGFNPSLAIGQSFPATTVSITPNDVILYALGVGASTKQPDHLKFLFELSEDFCTLPSFGVLLGQKGQTGIFTGGVPGLKSIDITKILHGEQYLEVYKPLPTSGTLTNKARIVDILDKGSGALILTETNSYDENQELLCTSQTAIFLVGAGGFGGKKTSDQAKLTVKPPSRSPDASLRETTSVDQAALYRLSGDANPLHIDPMFAAMGGFDQPILHGLCTFGFSCRHVLKQYADNDITKFKSVKVRFAKPVLPGQTIQTDMWREGSRIHFQTKVSETGTVVISGAYVDLVNLAPQPSAAQPSAAEPGLQSDLVFQEIARQLPNNKEVVRRTKGVLVFNLTKDGKQAGQWTVDLKVDGGAVYQGPPKGDKASVTVTMSDDDFVAIANGKLKPQEAFFAGRLKAKGNIMMVQEVSSLLIAKAKL